MIDLDSVIDRGFIQDVALVCNIWQASLPADLLDLPGQCWLAHLDLLLQDLSGQGALPLLPDGQHHAVPHTEQAQGGPNGKLGVKLGI